MQNSAESKVQRQKNGVASR